MKTLKLILIITTTMLLLDGLWLGFMGKRLYLPEYGNMLRTNGASIAPLWSAAVVVYIALIAGILLFVIPKANGDVLAALGWGAVFGLIVYAVYDFTNLSVMANWPIKITIIDTLWGGFLCAITSYVAVFFTRTS
jgi:uncharacterized membrane protein